MFMAPMIDLEYRDPELMHSIFLMFDGRERNQPALGDLTSLRQEIFHCDLIEDEVYHRVDTFCLRL